MIDVESDIQANLRSDHYRLVMKICIKLVFENAVVDNILTIELTAAKLETAKVLIR